MGYKIIIHGTEWNYEHIRESIEWAQKQKWTFNQFLKLIMTMNTALCAIGQFSILMTMSLGLAILMVATTGCALNAMK